MSDESEVDRVLAQYGPRPLPDVRPAEMRSPPLGQSNLIDRALSMFGQGAVDATREGLEGRRTPTEVARTYLTEGPMGPFGAVRAPPSIRAYHGSPRDFDEFVTPAFFSTREGTARHYRNDGGGMDNLNGLGGRDMPQGYHWAHDAMDRAGNDRARAIELLLEDIKKYSTPSRRRSDYERRGLIDTLLGRPPKLTSDAQYFMERQTEASRAGLDYLQSGRPLGRMYEVELPPPTAHYGLNYHGENQAADIADAIANGHKVIRWGGSPNRADSGEIVALSPDVIEILRKYGIAAPVAGATTADILSQYSSGPDGGSNEQ